MSRAGRNFSMVEQIKDSRVQAGALARADRPIEGTVTIGVRFGG
jgi:hypothetical protein